MGTNIVTRAVAKDALSVGFDDLDARMVRFGYSPKVIANQFQLSREEVRRLLKRRPDDQPTSELSDLMRQTGLPVQSQSWAGKIILCT